MYYLRKENFYEPIRFPIHTENSFREISQSKLSTFEKRLLKTVYFSHLYRYLFYEDFHGINLREKSVSVSGVSKDDTLTPSSCKFI